jgi:hypothetical protein
MAKYKRVVLLILITAGVSSLSVLSTPTQSQDSILKKPQQRETDKTRNIEIDTSKFPVTDYFAAKPSDYKERLKRDAISKKYNDRYSPRITEFTEKISSYSEWDRDLPSLPVASSAAVIIGEITKAEAFLSEDQSAIYSEFTVRIETIIKNSSVEPLTIGGVLKVERSGGRVRFPSGKIIVSSSANQNMPQVGNRYAFFLIQEFPMVGKVEHDFYLLTGYELSAGQVYPLDKVRAQIAAYYGSDEHSFLKELRSAANSASLNLP